MSVETMEPIAPTDDDQVDEKIDEQIKPVEIAKEPSTVPNAILDDDKYDKQEIAKWEKILAEEGLPAELDLDKDVWMSIEDCSNEKSAARSYAELRGYGASLNYNTGEHDMVARAISKIYGISKNQALQDLEDAFNDFDRRRN